jgi:antitoxin component of RelBE/YafQ-DinJ toxin-antitoxin module
MEFTIKIDSRKKEAKALLEYLKNLPFVQLEQEKPRYNAATEKAIQEARSGIGVTKVKNVADLFQKLNA